MTNRILNGEISKEEILRRVGNLSQIAYISPYECKEGRANGLKAFDVATGSGLLFTVLEGKCLDISRMSYKGINLNFLSKPGLVSQEFFNPHGNEFSRSFQAGLLYTCGLSNVGSGCTDEGKDYCTHGRISHTPADKVSVSSEWNGNEYVMKISGEMREAALFNENLVLKRSISAKLGSKIVEINDTVENQGFEEQPYMLLYHFNLGYPLLDEGARFRAASAETLPRDEEAAKGIGEFSEISAPLDGYKEQVFYHRMSSDNDGNTFAALINDRLQLGVYIKYNTRQLPRLIQWKSMSPGDYALGIEPANCLVEGRGRERERGTLKTIKPFEAIEFNLEIGVLDGSSEIGEFEKKLDAIV